MIYFSVGSFRNAEQALRQAAAIAEDNEDHSTLAKSLATLAAVYGELGGKTAEVESLRTRAVDLARIAFGPEHSQVGIYLTQLSISLIDRRRYREAEAMLQQALQLVDERTLPAYAAEIWVSRGGVAFHLGNYPEALERLDRAIGLYERTLGTGHPSLVPSLISAAHAQLKLELLRSAEETIERARRIAVSAFGEEHPILADVFSLRALILRRSGRKREAKESERQAKAIAALQMHDRRVMNSRIHVSDLAERRQ